MSTLCANAVSSATVLIDPGHSPKSVGTVSCAGKPEYLFNNALSVKLVDYLNKRHIDALLTKGPDDEADLGSRTGKSANADLLFSIHHDSVQPQFITRAAGGGQCSDKARGFSIFVSKKNVRYEKSLAYARKLGRALVRRGLHPSLHHAEKIAGENRQLIDPELGLYLYDELVLLKSASSPAVLLEAAVIVNPTDESLASSDHYRESIAQAVMEMMK